MTRLELTRASIGLEGKAYLSGQITINEQVQCSSLYVCGLNMPYLLD